MIPLPFLLLSPPLRQSRPGQNKRRHTKVLPAEQIQYIRTAQVHIQINYTILLLDFQWNARIAFQFKKSQSAHGVSCR